MKTNLLTTFAAMALILTSNQSIASGIREGNFVGKGLWKSENATGAYKVSVVIQNDTVSSEYELSDGSKLSWNFKMNGTANGFFKVKSQGVEIGSGYCLDRAEVCHYEIKTSKLNLEETLTILDGNLYRFGSKYMGKVKTAWQEALKNSKSAENESEERNAKNLERLEMRTEKLFKEL